MLICDTPFGDTLFGDTLFGDTLFRGCLKRFQQEKLPSLPRRGGTKCRGGSFLNEDFLAIIRQNLFIIIKFGIYLKKNMFC